MITQNNHNPFVYCCPHCHSKKLTLHGKDRGVRRYRCKTCLKTFKASYGTPQHGLHKKDKINKYLSALYQSMSVRQAAKYAGISKTTSFIWRHKFLSSLETETITNENIPPRTIKMITLEYSAKGRRKRPEKNQEPTKSILVYEAEQLTVYKLPSEKKIKYAIKALKLSKIKPIIYQKNKLLSSAIKKTENLQIVESQKNTKEQVQALNAQIEKLVSWMDRFKGVASKYLQQYWNWFSVLNNIKVLKTEYKVFARKCTERKSREYYQKLKNQ